MDPQQRLAGTLVGGVRAGRDRPGAIEGAAAPGSSSAPTARTTSTLLLDGEENVEGYLGTGNAASIVSGRIAYTFGLEARRSPSTRRARRRWWRSLPAVQSLAGGGDAPSRWQR